MPAALSPTPMPAGTVPPASAGAKPSDPASGAEGFLAGLLALAGATPGAAQASEGAGQGSTDMIASEPGAPGRADKKPAGDPATEAAAAASAVVPTATPPDAVMPVATDPSAPQQIPDAVAKLAPAAQTPGSGDAATGDAPMPADTPSAHTIMAKAAATATLETVAAIPAAPDAAAGDAPGAAAAGKKPPAHEAAADGQSTAEAGPLAGPKASLKPPVGPAAPSATATPADPPPKSSPSAEPDAAAGERRPPGGTADRSGTDTTASPAPPAPDAAPAAPLPPPPTPAPVAEDPAAAAPEVLASAAAAAAPPRAASTDRSAASGESGPSPPGPAANNHDGKAGTAPNAAPSNAASGPATAPTNGPDAGVRTPLDTLAGSPAAGTASPAPRPAATEATATTPPDPAPPKAAGENSTATPQAVADVHQPTAVHQPDAASSQRPAVPPPVTHQVALHISRAAEDGGHHLTVQLEPAALGRISVDVALGKDGHLSASITADRPDTLDLLQRDSRSLERALNDAGLKTDSGSLSFNLRGDGGRGGSESWTPMTFAAPAKAGDPPLIPAATPPQPVLPYPVLGTIDIRV